MGSNQSSGDNPRNAAPNKHASSSSSADHNPANYGNILSFWKYNQIIGEHVYIPNADEAIRRMIARLASEMKRRLKRQLQVLDLGCGPARMMRTVGVLPNVSLTGIDHDKLFVAGGRQLLEEAGLGHLPLIEEDFLHWQPSQRFDVVYSNGFHHHVKKGREVRRYLNKVRQLLAENGKYILSDEVLAPYEDEAERKVRAIIWYCHVIAIAILAGHGLLSTEEAKTLLDDLAEEAEEPGYYKTPAQIELILGQAPQIHEYTKAQSWDQVYALAEELLSQISVNRGKTPVGDKTIDLSRGDYKVDEWRLVREVCSAGFELIASKTYGDTLDVGGMGIYVFKAKAKTL